MSRLVAIPFRCNICSECSLQNVPHFPTAVVTWDREVYILNNGTLPTVCGLLRSKPTGRNVTVNVSFEAGDMAGWCSIVMYCFVDYHCIGLGLCNVMENGISLNASSNTIFTHRSCSDWRGNR